MEIVSVVAGLVSVVLAGFAIWMSWQFFQKSSANERALHDATEGLSATVDRIEALFDRFYADTFSLFQEAWTDMRRERGAGEGGPPGYALTPEDDGSLGTESAAREAVTESESPSVEDGGGAEDASEDPGSLRAEPESDVVEATPDDEDKTGRAPSTSGTFSEEVYDFILEAVRRRSDPERPLTIRSLATVAMKAGFSISEVGAALATARRAGDVIMIGGTEGVIFGTEEAAQAYKQQRHSKALSLLDDV